MTSSKTSLSDILQQIEQHRAAACQPRCVVGRRFDTGEPVRLHLADGKIQAVEPVQAIVAEDGSTSHPGADWPLIAPGLFDLQINGYAGRWFADPELTPDAAAAATWPYLQFGVTRICPTLITASYQALEQGLRAIDTACRNDPQLERMIPGCHLEGPHISPVDGYRGAHPLSEVRPADWSEFQRLQEASGNRVRLVTLAAESPGAVEFITRATEAGVVISLGHTAATRDQICAAVDAGARLSTHLGNGAPALLRRHPNCIWDQLAEDRLQASLIVDGHHLPASVVQTIVRAKGKARCILTCDASGWAGCAPGEYGNHLGRVEVLEDGRIVPAGQRDLLAGSGAGTDTCVAMVCDQAGVTLPEAIAMTTSHPARLLGYPDYQMAAGDRADLMLFAPPQPGARRLEILATLLAGELLWGKLPPDSSL